MFDAQIRRLAQEIDVLEKQFTQRQQELAEYTASEKKLTETLQLLAREVVADTQAVRAESRSRDRNAAARAAGQRNARPARDRQGLDGEVPGLDAGSAIENRRTRERPFAPRPRTTSRSRKADLAVLDENIKAAQDKVRRTELRSPVNGIVNKLNVTTVGAVVAPGGAVMEIVPIDDTLLVEGRIKPQDIAFIRPEQDAVVKISAYDSSVYGSLKGKVERISADTIIDDKGDKNDRGETYYRVMVRTEKNHLGTTERPLPVIPGNGDDRRGPDRAKDGS